MSLVTRCPACGTSFRVVPDQLRISQGWVRCGQCAEIFDAEQAMRDAARPQPGSNTAAPRPATGSPAAPSQAAVPPSARAPAPTRDDERFAETHAGFADTIHEPAPSAGDDGSARRPPSSPAGDAATPTLVDMAPAWPQSAASEMPVTDSVASLDMEFADYQQTQVQPESAPAPLAAAGAAGGPDSAEAAEGRARSDALGASGTSGTSGAPDSSVTSVRSDPPDTSGTSGSAATPSTSNPEDASDASRPASHLASSVDLDGLAPSPTGSVSSPLPIATLPPADLGPGRLHVSPAEPATRSRTAATSPLGGLPLLRREAAQAPEPAPPPPTVTARPPAPRPLDPAVAELSFMRDAPIAAAVPVAPPAPRARRLQGASAAGAVLLALILLLQWLVHERDRLAAAAPALRPVVRALCVPLRCTVQAPRRIDAVVIDGSSFVALGEDGYRLGLNLRNRAPHAVALPALVLSLTDVQEQPVVRRVLLPAELGTPPTELPAHGEWAASVDLRMADNAGRARVVGYRLDAFYP
jgi:predicted Zn finger-like uncharacterized protein